MAKNFYEERLLPMIEKTVAAELETEHLKGILDGTLPQEKFEFQVKQNFNYLIEYAKAWSIGLSKCTDYDEMELWYEIVKETVEHEMTFYHEYWKEKLGIEFDDMKHTYMANVKRSYTSHELARSWEGDMAAQVTALLPCDFVYWHMGMALTAKCQLPEGHIYRDWMEFYTKGWFVEVCQKLIKLINKLTENKSERELALLEEIFAVGCNYEYLSWRDMYWKQETWPLADIFPKKKHNAVEKFELK